MAHCLLNPKALKDAVFKLERRNSLIDSLSLVIDKHSEYKKILAFFLGAKHLYSYVKDVPFLLPIHYSYLCFERAVNRLNFQYQNAASEAISILREFQHSILSAFNWHYEDYEKTPTSFIYMMVALLQRIPIDVIAHHGSQKLLYGLKQHLLKVIKTDSNIIVKVKQSLYPASFNPNYVGSYVIKTICHSNDLLYLPQVSLNVDGFKVRTIYIPSFDGVVIDGLEYRLKAKRPSRNIVLALAGHFQTEHDYLTRGCGKLVNMFNTTVVFINHRNYSQCSAVNAERRSDLARDVMAFADHYKNHHIVLYGMCGGAPIMAEAAKKCVTKGIKVKLILDRTADKYSHFFTPRAFERIRKIGLNHPDFLMENILGYFSNSAAWYVLLMPMITILYWIVILALYFTNNNQPLAQGIEHLPEEAVLLLQAKSRKEPEKEIPSITDMIVHPDYDIRHVFKVRRKSKKIILKIIVEAAEQLAGLVRKNCRLHGRLLLLAKAISSLTTLVRSENLTLWGYENERVKDAHSYLLSDLNTRSYIPTSTFIQSFFKNPCRPWKNKFEKLNTASYEKLHQLFSKMVIENPKVCAKQTIRFFSLLSEHQNLLYTLSNRAYMCSLPNVELFLDGVCKILICNESVSNEPTCSK